MTPQRHRFVFAFLSCVVLFGCGERVETDDAAPLLDAALARLQTIPTPQIPSPPNLGTTSRPDYIEVRRSLRKGDASTLREILTDAHRQFENGELSENGFYRSLEPV